ncbi:hypothetical protein FRC08_003631 [Ceratobasidium sp. 394]|nr:hypothetical protein FRC08_003631 [Ceratobasidium sp. 394]
MLGLNLAHTTRQAADHVYPDRDQEYRPLLPDLGNIDEVEVAVLRPLLRTFFNQLWAWQGGRGSAPYKAIAEDCLVGTWSFIDRASLPSCARMLQDPASMTYLEVRDWFKSLFRKPRDFQFTKVTKSDGSVVKIYTSPCQRRHPDSRLTWMPEALLFARKVEEQRAQTTRKVEQWKRLPVARTVGIYHVFTDTQLALIAQYSNRETDLVELADLVQQLDNFGGAHIPDGANPAPNAHMPDDLLTAPISSFFDKLWPHDAFFNTDAADHAQYALSTLLNWVMTGTQLRHTHSNTWLAGPAGARWAVAVLFHLIRALTHLDRRLEVPDGISCSFNPDAHKTNWHIVRATSTRLRAELESSRDILRETFADRSNVWRTQVVSLYEEGHKHSGPWLFGGVPLVRAATYAVPQDETDLHACYQAVKQQLSGAEDELARGVAESDSESAECIDIPEEELSSSDSDSAGQEGEFTSH